MADLRSRRVADGHPEAGPHAGDLPEGDRNEAGRNEDGPDRGRSWGADPENHAEADDPRTNGLVTNCDKAGGCPAVVANCAPNGPESSLSTAGPEEAGE